MVELRVAVRMVPLGTWCGRSVEVGGGEKRRKDEGKNGAEGNGG